MALTRLNADQVYRWYLAGPNAVANWAAPTIAELNANPTNTSTQPMKIWNLSCAVNVDGSQFDLDDPDVDDSLTFCQTSGNQEVLSRSASIVFNLAQAKERWTDATQFTAGVGYNSATLAQSLLAWRGVDYYAILSVGKAPDAAFAVGDKVKIAQVSTDWIVPDVGTGQNVSLVQTFAKRSFLNWNYQLAS